MVGPLVLVGLAAADPAVRIGVVLAAVAGAVVGAVSADA
jgi:hypothetical protein